MLPDGSALVHAGKGGADVYEVEVRAGPGQLTGLRIEALPHESLSDSGPGRGDGAGFSVTGIQAEVWTPSLQAVQESALSNAPNWGNWNSIGPFRVRSREEAFRTSFPPETNRDLSAVYEDGHLAWLERKNWTDGRVHYLQYLPDGPDLNGASYVYRTVEVAEPTSVVVSLGSHKGLKVWLNSVLLLSTDPTRDIAPDQEELQLDLRPGINEILLKLTNDLGTYGFYFQPYFAGEREARLRFATATADDGTWTPVNLDAVLDGRFGNRLGPCCRHGSGRRESGSGDETRPARSLAGRVKAETEPDPRLLRRGEGASGAFPHCGNLPGGEAARGVASDA